MDRFYRLDMKQKINPNKKANTYTNEKKEKC